MRPFNYGNSYYLIVTETFKDVRLVGTDQCDREIRGDTDNRMWRGTVRTSACSGSRNKPGQRTSGSQWCRCHVRRHVLPTETDGVRKTITP
ncbi:MAG: hypothetical protein IPP83_00415 [Flavobacteriales bacterium]|nr:hypothetical protein [Flavobacteriales bacterium]